MTIPTRMAIDWLLRVSQDRQQAALAELRALDPPLYRDVLKGLTELRHAAKSSASQPSSRQERDILCTAEARIIMDPKQERILNAQGVEIETTAQLPSIELRFFKVEADDITTTQFFNTWGLPPDESREPQRLHVHLPGRKMTLALINAVIADDGMFLQNDNGVVARARVAVKAQAYTWHRNLHPLSV